MAAVLAESFANGRCHGKVLIEESINPSVVACQYGVRGEIFQRAHELTQEGHKVTFTSVGNPHQLGQTPLTFLRQVVALCTAPFLMDDTRAVGAFPSDVVARARRYLKELKGGVGAYQESSGNACVRGEVCDYIARRDGVPRPQPADIYLTGGASTGVQFLLQTMIRRNQNDGILVPIPQYPLYSAAITLFGGKMVGYHLDEQTGWALSMDRLQATLMEAKYQGVNVRAIVIINPGNPTGQCIPAAQLQELVRFAYTHRLVLMADEVYQDNVYGSVPFDSCYKVLCRMGEPYASNQELVSFHSISKGASGECGLRGAYFHLANFDAGVKANLCKLMSLNLCSSVPGMVALGCYLNPPQEGDPSHERYRRERSSILDSLRRRAQLMSEAFNSMPGISCQPVEGALYAFPRIRLPAGAIDEAAKQGKAPDAFYCMELLERALIAATPGSSFQQEDGTLHFRTTILPPEEGFDDLLERFSSFHARFMQRYGEGEPRERKGSAALAPELWAFAGA